MIELMDSLKDLNPEDAAEQYYLSMNMGKNVFSKRQNKYFFRLLQMFGFRGGSLPSFIDKDHLI